MGYHSTFVKAQHCKALMGYSSQPWCVPCSHPLPCCPASWLAAPHLRAHSVPKHAFGMRLMVFGCYVTLHQEVKGAKVSTTCLSMALFALTLASEFVLFVPKIFLGRLNVSHLLFPPCCHTYDSVAYSLDCSSHVLKVSSTSFDLYPFHHPIEQQ